VFCKVAGLTQSQAIINLKSQFWEHRLGFDVMSMQDLLVCFTTALAGVAITFLD
jgi:hypothetical protein